ncbi:hypothetical protein VTL71DRAFT_15593 [Oculimacula yallundae]|uniref:Uncharacterized protein n=1 Tax=Oculimacula yallundae TaxID=86028 RepID=A0ABR4CH24_9HELO
MPQRVSPMQRRQEVIVAWCHPPQWTPPTVDVIEEHYSQIIICAFISWRYRGRVIPMTGSSTARKPKDRMHKPGYGSRGGSYVVDEHSARKLVLRPLQRSIQQKFRDVKRTRCVLEEDMGRRVRGEIVGP